MHKISKCVEELLSVEGIKADIIIPVPGHLPRKVSPSLRELTEIISKDLGIKNGTNWIKRIKQIDDHRNSESTTRLAHEQYNTLEVTGLVKGKNVLLIDDIFTSGNTVAACVKKTKR